MLAKPFLARPSCVLLLPPRFLVVDLSQVKSGWYPSSLQISSRLYRAWRQVPLLYFHAVYVTVHGYLLLSILDAGHTFGLALNTPCHNLADFPDPRITADAAAYATYVVSCHRLFHSVETLELFPLTALGYSLFTACSLLCGRALSTTTTI